MPEYSDKPILGGPERWRFEVLMSGDLYGGSSAPDDFDAFKACIDAQSIMECYDRARREGKESYSFFHSLIETIALAVQGKALEPEQAYVTVRDAVFSNLSGPEAGTRNA